MKDEKSSANPGGAGNGGEVLTKVMHMIEREGVSQREISRESGLSQTTLSQYLKGAYPGTLEMVEAKLGKWLRSRKRKAKYTKILRGSKDWADTLTASKILMLLEYCQMSGVMGLIFGASGVGKSRAIENYRENFSSIWIATMSGAHGGVMAALEEVAHALGLREIPGRPARLLHEIVRVLIGTNGLLIIDEAQHLSAQALEAIRAIHDSTGIGLVLVGNEVVHARISGGKRAAVFAQLFSRLGKTLRITGSSRSDVAALSSLYGIKNDEEIKTLWGIGRKPGGLRSVTNVLRLASVMSLAEDRSEVDKDLILSAWADLCGEPFAEP